MEEVIYHPYETIELDGEEVKIDQKMGPLVREMNKIGLKTVSCCQGGEIEYDNRNYNSGRHVAIDLGNINIEIMKNGAGKQRLIIRWD